VSLSSDNESDTSVVDTSDSDGEGALAQAAPSSFKKCKYSTIIDNRTHVNNICDNV
jgi:hypothetical protein